jgi:hypothetical protein
MILNDNDDVTNSFASPLYKHDVLIVCAEGNMQLSVISRITG